MVPSAPRAGEEKWRYPGSGTTHLRVPEELMA
jgi:hypothetical protein